MTPPPPRPQRPTAETSVRRAKLEADWTLDGVRLWEREAEAREAAAKVLDLWL